MSLTTDYQSFCDTVHAFFDEMYPLPPQAANAPMSPEHEMQVITFCVGILAGMSYCAMYPKSAAQLHRQLSGVFSIMDDKFTLSPSYMDLLAARIRDVIHLPERDKLDIWQSLSGAQGYAETERVVPGLVNGEFAWKPVPLGTPYHLTEGLEDGTELQSSTPD